MLATVGTEKIYCLFARLKKNDAKVGKKVDMYGVVFSLLREESEACDAKQPQGNQVIFADLYVSLKKGSPGSSSMPNQPSTQS